MPGDYFDDVMRLFGQTPSGDPGGELTPGAVGTDAPPLPWLYGIADLGSGPSALLSPGPGERAQWIAPGQEVGVFRLQEVSSTQLVFTFRGQRMAVPPASLRKGGQTFQTARTVPARNSPGGQSAERASRREAPVRPPTRAGRYRVGAEFRPGRFGADAGDGATEGTLSEGFVRRVRQTPFGEQHWWERVSPRPREAGERPAGGRGQGRNI